MNENKKTALPEWLSALGSLKDVEADVVWWWEGNNSYSRGR